MTGMRRPCLQVTTGVVVELTVLRAAWEAWQGGAQPCRNR
jgi:hypothetical protein